MGQIRSSLIYGWRWDRNALTTSSQEVFLTSVGCSPTGWLDDDSFLVRDLNNNGSR
jgi:hypothetical protein